MLRCDALSRLKQYEDGAILFAMQSTGEMKLYMQWECRIVLVTSQSSNFGLRRVIFEARSGL